LYHFTLVLQEQRETPSAGLACTKHPVFLASKRLRSDGAVGSHDLPREFKVRV
jgi:hypothetical protein